MKAWRGSASWISAELSLGTSLQHLSQTQGLDLRVFLVSFILSLIYKMEWQAVIFGQKLRHCRIHSQWTELD